MKTMGIRQAKAHLSALVRDAPKGECCLVTDNREPVAMIGPPPQEPTKPEVSSLLANEEIRLPSKAAAFRKALFSMPSPIEVDF